MPEGGRCQIDPYWVCGSGLQCISQFCRKTSPEWHVCEAPGTICATGLTCAGGPPKRCIRTSHEGKPCGGDPYLVCTTGLKCTSNVCEKPVIPQGGVCDAPGSVCAAGLTCAGGPPKKCITLMNEGQRCGVDPYWLCATGLNVFLKSVGRLFRKAVLAKLLVRPVQLDSHVVTVHRRNVSG